MPRTVQQTSQDGRKNFHRRGISYRLIPLIILLGLILPLLAAAIHIREDYQKEKDNLAGTFKQIESVILPSLRQAAWIADRELLESNLRGVLNFPFIKYLEYRDRNNRLLVAARSSRPTDPITREYTLNYRYNDKDYNLGTLQVAASFDEAKSSLRTHFLEILLTLFLTALSISVSLVITFHFMINRHLTTMALCPTDRLQAPAHRLPSSAPHPGITTNSTRWSSPSTQSGQIYTVHSPNSSKARRNSRQKSPNGNRPPQS